jgi:plasmid stability protein
MADLVLRNLDRSIVETLKKRALRHGRSAEAEHREILGSALARTRRTTFAHALSAIPSVGTDEDFARGPWGRVLNLDILSSSNRQRAWRRIGAHGARSPATTYFAQIVAAPYDFLQRTGFFQGFLALGEDAALLRV